MYDLRELIIYQAVLGPYCSQYWFPGSDGAF